MKSFLDFHKKMEQFFNDFWKKMVCLYHQYRGLAMSFLHFLLFRVNPFWIQLSYFLTISLVGFLALKLTKPEHKSFTPESIDVLFTSMSAGTVSSMSTVEMEGFSNVQLLIIAILMLLGGEVFTSMIELQLMKLKFTQKNGFEDGVVHTVGTSSSTFVDLIELGMVNIHHWEVSVKPDAGICSISREKETYRYKCIKVLALIVSCYLIVVHVVGFTLVSLYMSVVPSATSLLKEKGLSLQIYSIFTTISTFGNGGFLPTNEGMMVFKKNSGLLLILIPQILLGNTLYPACLNLIIWVFSKITKDTRFPYILENQTALGFSHLLSSLHSIFLSITVFGFIMSQLVLFCSLEWDSEATAGLNPYQKLVASLFQVVNSRYAGESVFDLSLMTPAILVVFIVMMYLPPYTSFLPVGDENDINEREKRRNRIQRKNFVDCLFFSQLPYLVIFVILICITEKEKLKDDPLNFNVLSIALEVTSAYGNVGFSMGYSCARQIKPDGLCKDQWFGFVGRWSNKGKFVLIVVMLFGRLKKFNISGGKAWKLS